MRNEGDATGSGSTLKPAAPVMVKTFCFLGSINIHFHIHAQIIVDYSHKQYRYAMKTKEDRKMAKALAQGCSMDLVSNKQCFKVPKIRETMLKKKEELKRYVPKLFILCCVQIHLKPWRVLNGLIS